MTATTDGLAAVAPDVRPARAPGGSPGRSVVRRIAGSGWLPAVLVVAFTVVALRFYGVPFTSTAAFGGYLGLGVILPGTLVWRLLYRGPGSFVADVACGTALGYAGEVFAYIPARAVGAPLLVLVWPVATIVVFLAVPGLRRYWRSSPDRERPPLLWAWSMAGTAGLLVVFAFKFFRRYGLTWPYNSTPDTDSTFHLALVGEAKHHMPMSIPWVHGEPLYYHWFVYADMAATSWVTGIEPLVLLLRLSLLPMFVASAILLALLARKLFGHWWTGPAAVVISMFVLAIDPYRWQLSGFYTNLAFNGIDDGGSLRLTSFTSPTQTFGAMLFLPVVLLVVDLLRGQHRDKRRWIALVLMLGAVMGGKATYIPLLLAGLLVVIAGNLVTRRGWHRPALVITGVVLVFELFAQFVLLGDASQGLQLTPLFTEQTSGIGSTTGFTHDPRMSRLLVLAMISAWCWLCIWSGISGLVRRRRLFDTDILLLLGMGIAGMGGTALTGQAGDAQMYFIESVRPFLALAAVGGLVAVLRDGRLRRRDGVALVGAAAVGAASVLVIRHLGSSRVPTIRTTGSAKHLAVALLWPYALTVVVAVAAVVIVWLVRRRVPAMKGISHALIIALLAGFGLSTAFSDYTRIVRESRSSGWRDVVAGTPLVSKGTLEAGRWLRDHSDPDALVATNAHCLRLYRSGDCTDLHFSMSAYSERQMLVEGWGFTTTAHERAVLQHVGDIVVPYWKPQVLADNDAAFATPSAQTIDLLRDRYGVTWLFVDDTQTPYSADLGEFATLRFRSGDCAVYQIPPAGG
ncbi:MAG TPA: hypothetical protein VGJ07_06900 [Rugosimonospora sp.]